MAVSDKIMLFQPKQPPAPFISVQASCVTGWKRTGSLIRMSGPQALQLWTRWIVTSGAPCWKSIINSSRSLRRLMSWKSPCRPSGKSCHKNTSTRRWRTSPRVWRSDRLRGYGCQWWSLPASAVTLCVSKSASSSHHQQTGSFQSHQQTTGENYAQNAKNGGCFS